MKPGREKVVAKAKKTRSSTAPAGPVFRQNETNAGFLKRATCPGLTYIQKIESKAKFKEQEEELHV